jgi:hypothetical protein
VTSAATTVVAPAFIRGETVTDALVSFGGRGGEAQFAAPDPGRIVGRLALRDPNALSDVHELAFEEIVAYLVELGPRLALDRNRLLQEALEHAEGFSDLTPPLVRSSFEQLPGLFSEAAVREIAERSIGVDYLDGWVEHRLVDGRVAAIRAMGARAVHIIAGNSPLISALTLIRNAITRSDAIVKAPSNDPLTALAIARTMGKMSPDHPLTRHISVAYWKGGDTDFEAQLYQPRNIEKIVAWGGLASVTHVLRYVRPGLELITLDPKRSATIIGAEAFADEATRKEVALRAATDVGALNQLGCVNARVIYVVASVEDANRFGELLYRSLMDLPDRLSTKPRRFDPELRAQLQALRSSPDFYRVFGGRDDEGAVIVSQLDDPVDFHRSLSGRVANIVPVQGVERILPEINAWTQTIGIYPEALKRALRNALGMQGAQRLVSLGYAAHPSLALPQDAIEPVRRMVRWIVDERCDPEAIAPPWDR